MPNISEIICDLKAAGISLSLAAGLLKVEPKALLTDELRAVLKTWKAEIIEGIAGTVSGDAETLSNDPARTWQPGNTFTCSCGHTTGWLLAGEVVCPVCLHARQSGTPAPCQGCTRFEAMEIMGAAVPGCLYHATGQHVEGWCRLPADLNRCIRSGEKITNNHVVIKYA